MRIMIIFSAFLAASLVHADSLHELVDGPHRSQQEIARNEYRHPVKTLEFFEVEPNQTVVEIWPGGGWYTSILAPWLHQHGTYYAAHFPEDSDIPFYRRSVTLFKTRLAETPRIYNRVRVTALNPPTHTVIAPAGTVDRVLSFRNVHNWAKAGKTEAMFASFHDALKPGGILGIVEHRAPEARPLDRQIETGYMSEGYVIEHAEKAGFTLVARSEINANPKDQANHPAGVWTLPPTLRLGDKDRETYQAIGESDRMTLKFIKPESP
ncbi:MAG: methyltransferase [Pseudomonadota bacterium]|uniref:class I SAM-dependent methyltransferase n=1 Tax=Alcanivorax sp. TaxID=1872427 RepID=UPI0025C33704|nr:methyltransferase [Alcanivorax sp.]MED5238929.1 methyltransferase [Pseudomonadota bacterium]MEE3319456.1 methyltransferase [Pseudomonadota bacterium]